MSDPAPCLVIFCKRPALFHGKQRLAETIGAEQAHTFARLLLDCALEDARAWDGPLVLSPASADDSQWATDLLEREHLVLAQPDGCLGHRLRTIDQELRRRGQEQVIFIGTDAPMLTPAHYKEARQELSIHDVVLSPASDGGVTIMGTAKGWPDMTGLPWSTDRLGAALDNLCRQQGQRVHHITASYDIDVAADLQKLGRDLADDARPARQALHREIGEFLGQKEAKYG
ncbi:MAG: DUF2064 domain-containing protein [Rhodobacteraceae bacterium]|nr:DUF2064 domain-containing protein [Paracoccaceae bacterium]